MLRSVCRLFFSLSMLSCVQQPAFVVLTVEDPLNVASGFASLHVGTTPTDLKVVRELKRTVFPISVTVSMEKRGTHLLWVEARDAGQTPLGRGVTEAHLAQRGIPTAIVRLALVCTDASPCDDGLFCTGVEGCVNGMCVSGAPPCSANVECAEAACLDLGEGEGRCDIRVFHERCGSGRYCNPVRGCIEGAGCIENVDCTDASTCNGEEQCINFVCVPGGPPDVDDGDLCTLDGCDDRRLDLGLAAVFHVALTSLDGIGCTIPHTGDPGQDGVCVADKGGCAASECGDGVFGPDEACEDGNDNPNDGCALCRRTRWVTHVLSGFGQSAGAPMLADLGAQGVAVDLHGNYFIADAVNHRVWRVDANTGLLSILAGNGTAGSAGDDNAATAAQLNTPKSVSVDGSGNVFIADSGNHRIRRVCGDGMSCTVGHIATIAGNGVPGFSGDGGPGTIAQLDSPAGLAVDGAGNVFIADSGNHRIRRWCGDGIGCVAGSIITVAGSGAGGGFTGDGGPAVNAELQNPNGVSVDSGGNILIADTFNNRIRRVCQDGLSCTVGHIATVAGTGVWGYAIDDGPALTAQFRSPAAVSTDRAGNLFIADTFNNRIRRVCRDGVECTVGNIMTIAGNGTGGFSGDGGPATHAQLLLPHGVAVDAAGNVLIADTTNNRIRRWCKDGRGCTVGHIATVVGSGRAVFLGDWGPATSAQLRSPIGLSTDSAGNLLIADTFNHLVRRVCTDHTDCPQSPIVTLAGQGSAGSSGDGGPATAAQLYFPGSVITDVQGNILIADSENNRVRRVCLDGTGCTIDVITTVAGTGDQGAEGDGGPATSAQLNGPAGLALDQAGNILIADRKNHRIRRICVDGAGCGLGTIATVAGNGTAGFGGDGGPATAAQLNLPSSVSIDANGNILIADTENHRIRFVCVDGTACTAGHIETLAGTGTEGFSGEDAPAVDAQLRRPAGVASDDTGNVFIADTENHRIRVVCGDGGYCTSGNIMTIAGNGSAGFSGDGGFASTAQLNNPTAVHVNSEGDLLIADAWNHSIRQLCLSGAGCTAGQITTVAGAVDPEGNGAIETSRLGTPYAMAELDAWWIADGVTGRIRIVDLVSNTVDTVAGYPGGFAFDAAPARYSRLLMEPRGIAFDPTSTRVFLTEHAGHTIRAVNIGVTPWTISTFAGELGTPGYADGTGTAARLARPSGLLLVPATRELVIADTGNHVVRAIHLDSAATRTLAGTPHFRGFFGEGTEASLALLNGPEAIALGRDGSLYIADTQNNRVRRIDGMGIIDTVLGDGTSASSGEGHPARYFPVDRPIGLAVDSFGNLFVSSSTALKVVVAGETGLATGDSAMLTIYGRPPRNVFPEPVTSCLTGIAVTTGEAGTIDGRLHLLDACAGYLLQLDREAL